MGLPFGLFGMQGCEQKNGEYRSDLSSQGCTNGWMSETLLSKNKFYQRTVREFRSTFFNTPSLAQPEWCRSKYNGDCSLCEQFGHRRPKCPLKMRSMDSVFLQRPPYFPEYQAWLARLPQQADSPPAIVEPPLLMLLGSEAQTLGTSALLVDASPNNAIAASDVRVADSVELETESSCPSVDFVQSSVRPQASLPTASATVPPLRSVPVAPVSSAGKGAPTKRKRRAPPAY